MATENNQPETKMTEEQKSDSNEPKMPSTAIKKVFTEVQPDGRVSGHSIEYVWQIMNFLVLDLTKASVNSIKKEKTLLPSHMHTAVVEVLYGSLVKNANAASEKAILKHNSSKGGARAPVERKAGLHIPVSRIRKIINQEKGDLKVKKDYEIAMTAVVEYILAEIVEAAGKNAQQSKRATVYDYDIQKSIQNDIELSKCVGLYLDKIEIKNQEHPKGGKKKKEDEADPNPAASRKAPPPKKDAPPKVPSKKGAGGAKKAPATKGSLPKKVVKPVTTEGKTQLPAKKLNLVSGPSSKISLTKQSATPLSKLPRKLPVSNLPRPPKMKVSSANEDEPKVLTINKKEEPEKEKEEEKEEEEEENGITSEEEDVDDGEDGEDGEEGNDGEEED
jgi:histone H2A